jgi:uncharacterized protein YndB with AHSA1/START domain
MSQSESRAATAREATRSHETRIEIAAPIEDVWKALTEASEIARWFAPNIKVEPGVGGTFLADWGPGIEWKTAIEVWEPNRHLRLAETREQPEPCPLLQDYFLEAEGGKTVLRLVHSGFGTSAEWDNEYEGTRGGWPVCFFRLKHGLEHHRGESIHNIILTSVGHGIDTARAHELIESARPEPYEPALNAPTERAGVLPELNGSIFSYSVQPCPGGTMAYVQFLFFGLSDAKAASIQKEWSDKMARMFPAETASR